MAAFEGDLNCVGGFEPGSTLMLDATLVSAYDEIHTWTDDMLTGVDYSGTWAGSFTQAVEKHSHFTGTGGYKDKRFYLSQNSSFLDFVISNIDGVSAGDNLGISLSQGGSILRSATVSATV